MFGKGVYFADVGLRCHYCIILIVDLIIFSDDVQGVFVARLQGVLVANHFACSPRTIVTHSESIVELRSRTCLIPFPLQPQRKCRGIIALRSRR